MHLISSPKCKTCSLPFVYSANSSGEIDCLECTKNKPKYQKAFAVYKYNESCKNLVSRLKFQGQTELARYVALLMFKTFSRDEEIAQIISKIDFISYVPLNKKRLKERGFNQATLIAKHFAKFSGLKIKYNLIKKNENSKRQSELSIAERKVNAKKSFFANKKNKEVVKNKVILVVDDVITTGSTANRIASILKRMGAKEVYIAAFARVAKS